MKVIFFGTPDFAAKILKYLLQNGINIVAVVTKPDKAQGRSSELIPTPVKTVALEWNSNLPVYQPEIVSKEDFPPVLQKYQADLFVVVAYGEIIKQHLLDMPKKGCINLHGSLLPKYRGAAPIQRSIIAGETETGVTVIHMVKKMDAGDMIAKAKIAIDPNATSGDLEASLCQIGGELLLTVVREFENGIPPSIPQDHDQATFAPKIELEDGYVDWKQSATNLHNLIRGVSPHPGAWCWCTVKGQRKRLRLLSTELVKGYKGNCGQILHFDKKGFIVACGEDALNLRRVQLEGKKAMTFDEFVRGIPQDLFELVVCT